jgi:putative transposase
MAGEGHSIERSCRIAGVSNNGFFMWRKRPPSERSIRHAWLLDQIIEVHAASRGIYGARRVHAELTLGRGVTVGHGAIEMLMSRAGIHGLPGPKRRKRVPRIVTATDLVDREFARPEPDRLWVTDITEHPTREGKLYCCVVLDTFSRRVVGWLNLINLPLGPSPIGPANQDYFPRWEASVIVSTMPSSSRSGGGCKPSCSTGNGGTHESS